MFAALLKEVLGDKYDVAVGHTGLQGIALCLESRPDIVVTDIGMPDFDGIQMLKAFQKDPRLASIPVVVLTATHFTQRSRTEVSRFPQVRNVLSKTERVDFIAEEIERALDRAY